MHNVFQILADELFGFAFEMPRKRPVHRQHRSIGQESADQGRLFVDHGLELFFAASYRLADALGPSPRAQDGDEHTFVIDIGFGKREVEIDLFTVVVQADDVALHIDDPDRPRFNALARELIELEDVGRGQQRAHAVTDDFVRTLGQQLFGLRVDMTNDSVAVEDDNGVGKRVENRRIAQSRLGKPTGHVVRIRRYLFEQRICDGDSKKTWLFTALVSIDLRRRWCDEMDDFALKILSLRVVGLICPA